MRSAEWVVSARLRFSGLQDHVTTRGLRLPDGTPIDLHDGCGNALWCARTPSGTPRAGPHGSAQGRTGAHRGAQARTGAHRCARVPQAAHGAHGFFFSARPFHGLHGSAQKNMVTQTCRNPDRLMNSWSCRARSSSDAKPEWPDRLSTPVWTIVVNFFFDPRSGMPSWFQRAYHTLVL